MTYPDLHIETVSEQLLVTLETLMKMETLSSFRLVGGTSLSLQLGHRKSVDIDLFTGAAYGTIDFHEIDRAMEKHFQIVRITAQDDVAFGKSYYAGRTEEELIKIDLFYHEPFVFDPVIVGNLRLSSVKEIAAMKLEVIGHNGRKKDFWDLDELLDHFSWDDLVRCYELKYPFGHSKAELIHKVTDFDSADEDFDPICLRGKAWDIIKLNMIELQTAHL